MPLEARSAGMGALTPRGLVRRLTPRECERLQGFPDDYTLIDSEPPHVSLAKVEADLVKYYQRTGHTLEAAQVLARIADGPRYRALGNSMAVPVMRWIARRIESVEAVLKTPRARRRSAG